MSKFKITTKNFKIFNLFTITIFILVSVFFISNQAQADGHNVHGHAWSENIGWISFNCDDHGTCGTIDYGVDIDTDTGKFSGWAWSENIGWINFNNSTHSLINYPKVEGYLEQEATLNTSKTCDKKDRIVNGWAQVENTKAWIKMSGTNYQVQRDGQTENLTGWAWSEDFGWISFKGSNYKVSTFISDYEPGAENPSTSEFKENCIWNGFRPQIKLYWDFVPCKNDDSQTGYQIQIADNIDFNNPIIDITKTDANGFYFVEGNENKLEYGITTEKSYYWQVKVQSNNKTWSKYLYGGEFKTPKHPYPEAVEFECSKDNTNYVPCKTLKVNAGDTISFKISDKSFMKDNYYLETCGGLLPLMPEGDLKDICKDLYIEKRVWEFGSKCKKPEDCNINDETCNKNEICEKTITINNKEEMKGKEVISRKYDKIENLSENLSLNITDNNKYSCDVKTKFERNKVNFPLPIWKEVIPKN
ncbi:hypothetical protein CVV26_01605 [Candidatus Kuenenbacteria bacterium HGW-Kuenenbacteria-1]|uniref:Ig-like domain-containing protein n=1 Tax=Candidatus Kuenenbacteria bacterium HGW-Kuenenbacteria-1 TaxID=2013812 RepID=A0A2N1UNT5_9BACT|nr:MAG: hypothetical protein CVV26_01605 [Candidatus Kuenenbacteria bacterium HGW-Kuenenbacteria-1]